MNGRVRAACLSCCILWGSTWMFIELGLRDLLGTAVTYLFLFWLILRVPLTAIGAIPLLDTTVAVGLGAVVLGEPLGWPLLAGGALVLAGAALGNQVPAGPAPERG